MLSGSGDGRHACLMFEEAPLGEATAFRFYAVPLREIAIEESAAGK